MLGKKKDQLITEVVVCSNEKGINEKIHAINSVMEEDEESNVQSQKEIYELDFTPVVSKRNLKIQKRNSNERKKRTQGVPLSGTFSLRKTQINHPLCDIIVGQRNRKIPNRFKC